MGETKLNRFVYNHVPVFIQNIMCSIYGYQKIRYRYHSPLYEKWLRFYTESASWPDEKLRAYQLEQTMRTIHYAYQHVPFYKERFDEIGITPDDIKTIEDMKKMPYLEKSDIRRAGKGLISDEYRPEELFVHPTSGSTGTPLILYNNRIGAIRSHACRWAQCRPNISMGEPYANFTGLELIEPGRHKPPFWRMNWAARQRLYSVFHMNDQTLPYYIEDLSRFRPLWLYGYPSAIYTVAEFIIRTGYTYPSPPKAVVVSSEQCLPHYRRMIEQAFKTRLWDEYGQGEMAGLAFECTCGKFHERADYSLMEFIPTGQKEDDFDVCELICTSFINDAWPLIRYRVGDLAVVSPDAKCPFGLPGRVIERIYGRTGHFLVAGDGSRISNISVMAKKCRNIRAMQAVQEKVGYLRLVVVPEKEYDVKADEPFMIEQFRKKLGDESRMHIDVEYVAGIPLTKAGKFLSIVSKISTS